MKGAPHALLNPLLRAQPTFIELPPIRLLLLFHIAHMGPLLRQPRLLLLILLLPELLQLRQVPYPLGRLLLLLSQLYYPILYLRFLIFYFLLIYDGVHHYVVCFLSSD